MKTRLSSSCFVISAWKTINSEKDLAFLSTETLFCQAEHDVSLGLECFIPNLSINYSG